MMHDLQKLLRMFAGMNASDARQALLVVTVFVETHWPQPTAPTTPTTGVANQPRRKRRTKAEMLIARSNGGGALAPGQHIGH